MKHRSAYRCSVVAALCCAFLVACPGVIPPNLWVSHNAINLGVTKVEENFLIQNHGGGVLAWTIDVAFTSPPAPPTTWLTVDQTSGTTTTETDLITLSADRTGLGSGVYNATVTVTPDVGDPHVVLIAMTVAGDPVLELSTNTLNVTCPDADTQFTIGNSGDFPMSWSATNLTPATDAVAILPPGGLLQAGVSEDVTVAVNCDAFNPGVHSFTFDIESDGGPTETMTLNIGIGVSPEISVAPLLLNFGQDLTTLPFEVWNSGAVGSILDFTITTDRPDLVLLDPVEGQSTATGVVLFPDLVPVAVTINRSAIQGENDSATITISAPDVEDAEVVVTVEAAPLTLEGAQNRTRPPFIMRFVFLIRDMLGEAIDTLDPVIFAELQTAFTILEDGVLLDPDESSFFVTPAEQLRYNVVLMLDYTGSMFQAAERANPGSGDALQELYAGDPANPADIGIAGEFVTDLPDTHRISLMQYHTRQQSERRIHGFSTEKMPILNALQAFTLPAADHGASEIYDAVADACQRLENEDLGTLSFGDADVRALVFITDGRDTSSITTLDQLINDAVEKRCRLYPIGFGEDVNAEPLVKMAIDTGGHYYAAPDLQTLRDLLANDSAVGVGAPGKVVTELRRQIVLSYVSLFQEGSHNYLVTANIDGQEGSFQRDAVFAIGGDVRAGQIGLTTTGIQPDGSAEVFVRAEYVPRNTSQLRLRLFTRPNTPFSVEIAPNGLLTDGWILVEETETPPTIADSRVFTLLTTEDNPLKFASFGNLLRVRFTALDPLDVIQLGFRVDNRILVNPPVTKFFQYPDEIIVQEGSAAADVIPVLLADGFDPDAPGAFNRDEDIADDFDDEFPDNEFAQ